MLKSGAAKAAPALAVPTPLTPNAQIFSGIPLGCDSMLLPLKFDLITHILGKVMALLCPQRVHACLSCSASLVAHDFSKHNAQILSLQFPLDCDSMLLPLKYDL